MISLRFLEDLARTVVALVVMVPLLLLCSGATIFQRLLGSRNTGVNWAYRLLSRTFVALSGSHLEVHGKQHLVPGQAYVVVSNHESNLDPFALMRAVPELVVRFVLKRELIQVPVFGQALALSGNIAVERRSKPGGSDVRRIQQSMLERDPGVSLLFFAEGTRAKDGRLQPFKKGAFATAITAGLPLLPVGIAGTYFVLQPGRLWLRRGGLAIEVGAPIPVTAQTGRDELHAETFKAVAELRAQARARLRALGFEPGGRDA